jgi:hypothetical protein
MNGPSECWGVIQENSLRDDRGCLTWLGHVQTKGYGFTMRIVWQHFNGAIPEGMSVMHKCDNRRCCEPRHLMLGTNADNILDKTKKGRAGKKLTKEDIPVIRKMLANGISQREIAENYGVNPTSIHYIKSGRHWAHH